MLSALHQLDHGEEGEADVDIGGRTLRIRFDPLKKRVLMFELKKARTAIPASEVRAQQPSNEKPAAPG